MNRAILLIGPTGSGKTPLGEFLGRHGLRGKPCFHFDFGEHLRRVAEGGRPGAPIAAGLSEDDIAFVDSVVNSGVLLEDGHFRIAEALLRGFIEQRRVPGDALVILNGLPRHVGQARNVAGIVDIAAVVVLHCTPEAVLERLASNVGGDRAQRSDDDPAAVRAKLDLFEQRTRPLVAHYRAQGVRVVTIDIGPKTPPEEALAELSRCMG